MSNLKEERDVYDSVSESCFLIPPRRKGGDLVDGLDHIQFDGFRKLFSGRESIANVKYRHRLYQQTWTHIKTSIDNLVIKLNMKAINEIADFVRHSYTRSLKSKFSIRPYQEIPTGLIFAGINVPDNHLLFKRIGDTLTAEDGHCVANLESKDCHNLKTTMKLMISQFLNSRGKTAEVMDISEDEDNQAVDYKITTYDMQVLEGWYKSVSDSATNSDPVKHLVVVIQDMEGFDPLLLGDLITICSEYCDKIPIVLLMGIATSVEALHQSLSKDALTLLRAEKFFFQRPNEILGSIIEEVLLSDPTGFKLGVDAYKLLTGNFFEHNFSVNSFMCSLQYAVMTHFYSNPMSILSLQSKVPPRSMFSRDHCEYIRMQPSFRSVVQSMKPNMEEVKKLLEDDDYLVTKLPGFLQDFTLYHAKYSKALECVCALQNVFAGGSLRKPKRILYFYGLNDNLYDTQHIKSLFMLVKKLELKGMKKLLEDLESVLKKRKDKSFSFEGELIQVQDFLEKLYTIEETFGNDTSGSDSETKNLTASSNVESKRTSRVSSRTNAVDVQPEEVQYYTSLVNDVFEFLNDFFRYTHFTT
ncbi:Origin recognition complex subunit 3, variant 2 [Basidiobolus ranarum]|uniref:Origin recognition complex subunit 3, variant 2 n=1 Tax=Basidiobolus ranarum TaxID=34480 RepID=A0ABR2WQC4_9FUNG